MRIIDEFSVISKKTGKSTTVSLLKYGNGDFRIRYGKSIYSSHSIKSVAEETFEKLKKRFGV